MATGKIYIFFGLIASGKSTLAEQFAAVHHFPYYNTDRVRKELAGIEVTERRADDLGQGIYAPAYTEKTYNEMLVRAGHDLQKGEEAVVLDGSYSRLDDRKKVFDLAEALGVDVLFVLCSCSEKEVKRRLQLRAKDPNAVSDGRWEIFVKQKNSFEFPDELNGDQLLRLDTEADPAKLVSLLQNSIKNRT